MYKIDIIMGDCMKFDKKKQIFRVITTILTLLIIAFIFYNSLMPAGESSQSSGRVLRFLNGICEFLGLGSLFTHSFVRTLAHFSEFAVLGASSLLMYLSYLGFKVRDLILALATVLSVAITDECIQLFSAGRTFQFEDIFVDFSGGTLGASFLFLIIFVVKIIKRRRYKNGKSNQ